MKKNQEPNSEKWTDDGSGNLAPHEPQPGVDKSVPAKADTRNHGSISRQTAEPTSADAGSGIGAAMIVGFWVIFLGLGYLWASKHFAFMQNPNTSPVTRSSGETSRVALAINRYGHYVTNGTINGETVTFLLDTGATSVSLSAQLASRLGLKPGRPIQLNTANGPVTGHSVSLDSVAIGSLERRNLRAVINPGQADDEVLLGMTYLRHFQLTQNRDMLTIESYPQ